jgi:stage V sporulation protein D (sporulation-specific penicillin-binding protein)
LYPELLIRKRLLLLTCVFVLLFGAVGLRIGSLTIFQAESLTARGVSQWTRSGAVAARRGSIVDRLGQTITLSTTAYIVCANPQLVKDPEAMLDILCPLLTINRENAQKKITDKAKASVILKRQVSREVVDEIRSLMTQPEYQTSKVLQGISFDEDTMRWYPKGEFLSQVLGLTNVDSVGQSGLEQQYDTLLKGRPGAFVHEVDARARTLPDGQTAYIEPQAGNTLKLTIDNTIQGFCEKAMRECLEVNDAKAVHAIVMDVKTGAILAMTTKPDYDPNNPPRDAIDTLNQLMRINIISNVYEPGSTFKIVTASAAIDSGVTNPEDRFYCSGKITVDGDTIRCWGSPHGAESMREGLQNSCNPVFVELAVRMGKDTFYKYLKAFGLGTSTGIDLPGEATGILINSRYVKTVDIARIGFGQSIAVTPLQLITASCAAVNGGRLLKPYLVAEILSPDGEVLQRNGAQVVANPITPETSATMRELLESVVAEGGGRNAAITGYRIGGKTGTAQVYKDGKIVRDVHIGSFLGFAPADNPQFAILVVVDEAHVPVDYGGTTAAPFAKQVMTDTLKYLGISPADPNATPRPEVTVPDIGGYSLKDAKKALGELKLISVDDGQSDTVTGQMPAAGTILPIGSQVMLYTQQGEVLTPMELVRVPDAFGLSMAEAGRVLRMRTLEMEIAGSGLAVSQTPAAGEFVAPGTIVTVQFQMPGG